MAVLWSFSFMKGWSKKVIFLIFDFQSPTGHLWGAECCPGQVEGAGVVLHQPGEDVHGPAVSAVLPNLISIIILLQAFWQILQHWWQAPVYIILNNSYFPLNIKLASNQYILGLLDSIWICMCAKNDIDIAEKSSTTTSQTGEPLEINVDIVDNTVSPKSKVNQASRTSISTICVRKRT